MRVARSSFSIALFVLVGVTACRTASQARIDDDSRTTSAPVASEPAPVVVRVLDPAAVPAPAAVAKGVEVAPNRDKHGNADVAAYLDTLQSAKRIADLQVDVVIAKLALPPDAVIGDLGCGPGIFSVAFARACPEGIVYASDIEPRQLDAVRAKIHSTKVKNIVPVLASEDDAHFPPATLDVVFLADAYHHLDDRVAYLRKLSNSLKPGGRIVILDYKPGKLDVGPPPEHKLKAGVMDQELVDAGCKLVERFDTHENHDFEVWRVVQPWEKK